MPRQSKVAAYHLRVMEEMSSSEVVDYLCDLMAGEGLSPMADVLAAYNRDHGDGLYVFTKILQREIEFEGNVGDLVESLAHHFKSTKG